MLRGVNIFTDGRFIRSMAALNRLYPFLPPIINRCCTHGTLKRMFYFVKIYIDINSAFHNDS